jgi:SNF family Na+-dependent transporter
MDWQIVFTLGLLALALAAMIRELAAPDLVLMAALICFGATGILSPSETFAGFANPVVATVGALFIALPGAFVAMGAAGRVIGILFFVALMVGAVTSAVSLLEVVTASVIDETKIDRKKASIIGGVLIAILGVLPAISLDFLGVMDKLAEALLALGAFFMAIFVGWVAVGAADEIKKGAPESFHRYVPSLMASIRWVVPPVILFAAVYAFMAVWREYMTAFGG